MPHQRHFTKSQLSNFIKSKPYKVTCSKVNLKVLSINMHNSNLNSSLILHKRTEKTLCVQI